MSSWTRFAAVAIRLSRSDSGSMNRRNTDFLCSQRSHDRSLEICLDSPSSVKRLNTSLNRRLNRFITVLLSGQPYRPPNHLREACKILRLYVRLAERDRKRNPEAYDPLRAVRRLEQQRWDEEIQRALDTVYGTDQEAVSGSPTISGVHPATFEGPVKKR
jgi:hypothetical protein